MLSTLVVFIGIVNLFAGLAIIFLVLMQQGKGADAGASFGSSSSQGLFGAAGAANFLSRSTAIAATIFFITCLMLAYASAKNGKVISNTKDSSSHSKPVHDIQNKPLALPSLPDAKNKEDMKRSLTQVQASQDTNSHSKPMHDIQNKPLALPSLPDAKNKEDMKRSLTQVQASQDTNSHSKPMHDIQNKPLALPSLPDTKNKEDMKRSLTQVQASQDTKPKQAFNNNLNNKKNSNKALANQKINKTTESSKAVRVLFNSTRTRLKKNISATSIRADTSHPKSKKAAVLINKHPQINGKKNIRKDIRK